MKRTFLLLFLLFFLCLAIPAAGDSYQIQPLPVSQMPLQETGTVRVLLSSIGERVTLDISVSGSYIARGLQTVMLSSGESIQLQLNAGTGEIAMIRGGYNIAMGNQLLLLRNDASDRNGLRISQSRYPSNLYTGDLYLTGVVTSASYRLQPILYVPVESYLAGALPHMLGDTVPAEAMKAQAVVARTYAMRRSQSRQNEAYDVTDTVSDQVYYGQGTLSDAWRQAIAATSGTVLLCGSGYAEACYTVSNGGQTESAANVWHTAGMDYLSVHDDPFDAASPAAPVKTISIDAACTHAALRSYLGSRLLQVLGTDSFTSIASITPNTPQYGSPSRLYTRLNFVLNVNYGGRTQQVSINCDIFPELEKLLGMSLNSAANELWTVQSTGSGFRLTAGRFGHGIGLSQYGAVKMAESGYSCSQILQFYFSGCASGTVRYTQTRQQSAAPMQTSAPMLPRTATVSTTSSALNVRSAPGGTIIGSLPRGTTVEVISEEGEWTAIRYEGADGYVKSSFLRLDPVVTMAPAATATPIPWTYYGTPAPAVQTTPQPTDSYSFWYGGTTAIPPQLYPASTATPVPWYGQTAAPDAWYQAPVSTPGPFWSGGYGIGDGYCGPVTATPLPWYYTATEAPVQKAYVNTSAGGLNFREAASSEARVMTVLPAGAEVTVLSLQGTWTMIRYQGQTGYVMSRYLTSSPVSAATTPVPTPVVTPVPTAVPVRYVTGGSLYLRNKASKDGTILASLPEGTEVSILGRNGNWSKVDARGLVGYVMTSYLSDTRPNISTPDPAEGTAWYDPSLTTLEGWTATAVSQIKMRLWCLNDAPYTVSIPQGATVTVLQIGNEWCRIGYGQWEGYCQTVKLRLIRP